MARELPPPRRAKHRLVVVDGDSGSLLTPGSIIHASGFQLTFITVFFNPACSVVPEAV